MRLEHGSVEKIKKDILNIVSKHLDVKNHKIFFFGSRVTGGGNERSDIDVGIEGSAPIPSAAWLEIQSDIENLQTLYKIEIVDFKRVSSEFKETALASVELIK